MIDEDALLRGYRAQKQLTERAPSVESYVENLGVDDEALRNLCRAWAGLNAGAACSPEHLATACGVRMFTLGLAPVTAGGT